jgi:hypothetical protein
MENDTVRSMGESTLVDICINGKMRSVCVLRGAIESFLQLPKGGPATSETERCEFVRTHLGAVVTAAKDQLAANPEAETLHIKLLRAREKEKPLVNRRRGGDRRKGDRRKGTPGDRRQSDRRSKADTTQE